MVKKVLLVRHGNYSGDDLTDDGFKASQKLAERLRVVLAEHVGKIAVVSSATPRARQTAEIIEIGLKTGRLEFRDEISDTWRVDEITDGASGLYTEKLTNGVDEMVDVVIVVTHDPFIREFMAIFRREFERGPNQAFVDYASAVVCNRELKTIGLLTVE